jgi:hypothetical protein
VFSFEIISFTPKNDSQNMINQNNLEKKSDPLVDILEYNNNCSDPQFVTLTTDRHLFQNCALSKNITEMGAKKLEFELKSELSPLYSELEPKDNVIVVFPTFTLSAYSEPGFYTFYRGDCDQEFHGVLFRDDDCLTVNIRTDFDGSYNTSDSGFKILNILNYNFITDIDIDKNPSILNSYDTVILLHNEYVTKTEFDAITSHPNVVYLYPNALYAEVSVDYENNTMTLIRGHNYPEITITNGFDWVFDNTHPMEYDNSCMPWYFYEIDNGLMLSCYPENVLLTDAFLLKALAEIDNPMWWNIYQKIDDKTVNEEEEDIFLEFFKLVPKK